MGRNDTIYKLFRWVIGPQTFGSCIVAFSSAGGNHLKDHLTSFGDFNSTILNSICQIQILWSVPPILKSAGKVRYHTGKVMSERSEFDPWRTQSTIPQMICTNLVPLERIAPVPIRVLLPRACRVSNSAFWGAEAKQEWID